MVAAQNARLTGLVFFDYGQRAPQRSWITRPLCCKRALAVPPDIIDMRGPLGAANLTGSALDDDILTYPDGHYAKITIAASLLCRTATR